MFLAALVPWLGLVWRFNAVGDDAFISFRYAKHLAAGHGLRYNLAESPPVEGFSNFLWVLLMAVPEGLGLDVTVFARVVSVACGALLLGLVFRRIRAESGDAPLPLAAGASFLATLPPFAVWSTSGLETMPFALAVFLTYDLLDPAGAAPRPLGAGCAALALALLRSDGVFWAALAIGVAAFGLRGSGRASLGVLVRTAGILAAGYAGFLLWRHAYFESWVSNAALAKLSLSALVLERGARYVAVLLLTCTSIPLALLAALPLLRRRPAGRAWRLVAMAGAPFGDASVVGGDWMAMGRFIVPGLPFLAVLVGLAAARASERGRAGRALAGGAAALLIVLSVLPAFDRHVVPHDWRQRFHFRWNVSAEDYRSEFRQWSYERSITEQWTRAGKALAELADTSRLSFAVGGIGARGYYTQLHIWDRFGLVDRELAREKLPRARVSPGHDRVVPGAYFERHRPSIIFADIVPRPAAPDEVARRLLWAVSLYWGEPVDRVRHFEPLVLELPRELSRGEDEVLFVVKRRGVSLRR